MFSPMSRFSVSWVRLSENAATIIKAVATAIWVPTNNRVLPAESCCPVFLPLCCNCFRKSAKFTSDADTNANTNDNSKQVTSATKTTTLSIDTTPTSGKLPIVSALNPLIPQAARNNASATDVIISRNDWAKILIKSVLRFAPNTACNANVRC